MTDPANFVKPTSSGVSNSAGRGRADGMTTLKVETDGHVAIVVVDNPPVNAFPDLEEVSQTFADLAAAPDLRAVVILGEGDRYFCTGLSRTDLSRASRSEGSTADQRTDHRYTRMVRLLEQLLDFELPLIGAINGLALGGGLALAASCDFLIASPNAAFGLPEVELSLLGGASHFRRLFPPAWTRYAHLTANRITADEAFRLGAVIRVVESDDLRSEAVTVAQRVASHPPAATRMAKRSLTFLEEGNLSVRSGYRYESTQTQLLNTYEDAAEARLAWSERRAGLYKLS